MTPLVGYSCLFIAVMLVVYIISKAVHKEIVSLPPLIKLMMADHAGFMPDWQYQTEGSAGFDIQSSINTEVLPNDIAVVPTNAIIELPTGYELQIRSRSGLAAKSKVVVLNSPGTVDSDYRAECKVILFNHGSLPFKISIGDRIAQGVVAKAEQAEFVEVSTLSETTRGSGGFGSTGTSSEAQGSNSGILNG